MECYQIQKLTFIWNWGHWFGWGWKWDFISTSNHECLMLLKLSKSTKDYHLSLDIRTNNCSKTKLIDECNQNFGLDKKNSR